MIMNIKNFIVNNFHKVNQTFFFNTKPHFVEKVMMEKCGYWPGNSLTVWKICIILFCQTCLTTLPGTKYMTNTIVSGDSKGFALVISEVILDIQQIFSFLNLIVFFDVIKNFQKTIDAEWKKYDNLKDWVKIKEKTAIFCNRVSILNHLNMHCSGFVYFFMPTLAFLAKFYFGSDEHIEKRTSILVE